MSVWVADYAEEANTVKVIPDVRISDGSMFHFVVEVIEDEDQLRVYTQTGWINGDDPIHIHTVPEDEGLDYSAVLATIQHDNEHVRSMRTLESPDTGLIFFVNVDPVW